MNKIKIASLFLLVTSILIHIFELGVSYAVVSDFVGSYVTNTAISIFFSIISLSVIVLGFRLFTELAFLPYPGQTGLQAIIIFLACTFGLASATLTTIGAGQVATSNLELTQHPDADPQLNTWEKQLSADNERMTALNRIQSKRKGGWMTQQEAEEMAILQKRIAMHTDLIAQESARLRELSGKVDAENQAALASHHTTHTSFGFLTQILLVVCVGIRYYLQQMLATDATADVARNTATGQQPEYAAAALIAVQPTTQPDPPVSPITPPTTPSGTDHTRPDTRTLIWDLHRQGLNGTEIANRLGVNKSTVSRAIAKGKIMKLKTA